MMTFEAFERCNKSSELVVEPLKPYPSSFKYKYSANGQRLQNTHSMWKEDDYRDEASHRLKRRKLELDDVTGLKPVMERDTFLRSLTFLDFPSLVRCLLLERSLRITILSPQFRRMWSHKQPPVMLISSYTLPCFLWAPGTPSTQRTSFHPLTSMPGSDYNQLAVASDSGLVCVRFQPKGDESSHILDLAVGNPLTGEWVALPQPDCFWELSGFRYSMEVGQPPSCNSDRVDFKVMVSSTSDKNHCCHVFDSVSGEWSSTSLHYPVRSDFKWSAFDLQSSTWRTELIRCLNVKTGLERSPTDVHRLPHPCCHHFCVWEYNGSTYLASPWTVEQLTFGGTMNSYGEFAGYGVWEVTKNGECLKPVATVWGVEAGASLVAVRLNVWSENLGVRCSARDNLVWFAMESEFSPAMGVVVYDMESCQWSVFDDQEVPPKEDPYDMLPGKHYGSAVLYTPSLIISPSRGGRLM